MDILAAYIACAPCVCLMPMEVRGDQWPTGTGDTDGCAPPLEC